MQIEQGRSNLDQLCAHLGISDSNHLPKTFRLLLPCAAAQAGVVDLPKDVIRRYRVDHTFWTAMACQVMLLARNGATVADVMSDPAFLAARQRWVSASGVTNAKIKSEEQLASQAIQVSSCLISVCS
jgi:hypothetical protein